MSSSLDPDAAEVIDQSPRADFGPSDTSDSASDVAGTGMESTDSDAVGTGERASVDSAVPSQTERDIAPDKIETGDADDDGQDDAMKVLDK